MINKTLGHTQAPEKPSQGGMGAVYRPTAPPKIERRRSMLWQALRLPTTVQAIYRVVREDFETAALDEHLWAFWGFHHEPWDRHYQVRPWQKSQLRLIEPQDVTGLAVWEMGLMLHIAMENEDPIREYTYQSGEGFRFLLPKLGRFMGTNQEQATYAAEHDLPWCENPWAAEERRHSKALARMLERLMKASPSRDNPHKPIVVTADEGDALRHIISRETTEWNASSSYIVMAAHSAGNLHSLIRELERDEIKHLAILSSVDLYLFGPRPWQRFSELVQTGIDNYRRQRKSRSGGDLLGSNFVSAVEGILAHLLTEYYIRKWLQCVPLRTLTAVFETPSNLPELAGSAPSPERRAQIDEALSKEKEKRLRLARWAPEMKRRALEDRSFEETNAGIIEEIVAGLDSFRGAEIPGSKEARRMLRRIWNSGTKRLRSALLNRMRDYQIRNNRHVLLRRDRWQPTDASLRV